MEWKPADTAPWGEVIWVRNAQMDQPVKATRGYAHNGVVHPDHSFFTSVFTEDKHMPFPAGRLVCPDEWAPLSE